MDEITRELAIKIMQDISDAGYDVYAVGGGMLAQIAHRQCDRAMYFDYISFF